MINIYRFRDSLHYVSMDAMSKGMYVTIVFYVSHNGITKIHGQTYKDCILQTEHQPKFGA